MQAIREMFWVAEYNNGQALPELDESTGKTNRFECVDHKNTIRFWWLPISPKMALIFPGTHYNPLLKRHAVALHGSKGFVARRIEFKMDMGKRKETPAEKARRLLSSPPLRVKCYVLGIENGPRREIYPDGTVINIEHPKKGETQEILHG
jgi:hypothetical protein